MTPLEREKLETLDGSRSTLRDAKRRAAVRIADLDGLLQLPERLQSDHAAGAAPTAAEHNALVDDVHKIHRRLLAISEALTSQLI